MSPRANGLAAVMEKQRQIKNEWVFELLENPAIGDQLRIIRRRQSIEFVDTYQRMLVRRVTMQKLVLHQTGELAEFGDVSPQEINPMHHSKDPANFPFPRQNRLKDVARSACILIRAGNLAEAAVHVITQVVLHI